MKYSRVFMLNGYDPFIDYVKGICILFVILTHNLPYQDEILFPFWGAQAVPCFLLLQVFHAYKKGILSPISINIKKVFNRIIRPYLIISILSFLMLCLVSNGTWLSILKGGIVCGGYGPGSYYVWVYLQFMSLIVLCRKLFVNYTGWKLLMIFVLLSSLFECLCYFASLLFSDNQQFFSAFYRLSFFRYFFLIYLGYMLVVNRYRSLVVFLFLNFLSLLFIFLFQYSGIKMAPFFYDNDAWRICHWICYFYVFSGFLYLLKYLFENCNFRSALLLQMGKYSYEIFLCQMFVFTFFKIEYLNFLSSGMRTLFYILFTTLLSIVPVLLYKKIISYKRL